jgi:hypothetical protein
LRALAHAASLRQPTLALHISPTEDEAQRFHNYWRTWGDHLPLAVVVSPTGLPSPHWSTKSGPCTTKPWVCHLPR